MELSRGTGPATVPGGADAPYEWVETVSVDLGVEVLAILPPGWTAEIARSYSHPRPLPASQPWPLSPSPTPFGYDRNPIVMRNCDASSTVAPLLSQSDYFGPLGVGGGASFGRCPSRWSHTIKIGSHTIKKSAVHSLSKSMITCGSFTPT